MDVHVKFQQSFPEPAHCWQEFSQPYHSVMLFFRCCNGMEQEAYFTLEMNPSPYWMSHLTAQ